MTDSPDQPITAHNLSAWVPVSHEMLVDSGGHVCGPGCPPPEPPWTPTPVPLATRLRRRGRRAWWWVKGIRSLRLVHKDRVDRECDC